MLYVPLSKGLFASIDDEDSVLISDYTWYAMEDISVSWKKKYYAVSKQKPRILMHRLILQASERVLVDHRDGDGLHNQRHNLRIASPTQNQANSAFVFGKSQYRGVSWSSATQRWRASIGKWPQRLHLGFFSTEEEAALAYDQAAKLRWGEFAHVNIRVNQ